MSLTAIVLLVISACMHAGWNFVGKRQYPTTGFFLVANWVGIACISPVLLYSWEKLVFIPQSVWILSVVGGSFYSLYCAALAAAYRAGDLSIAYPLSVSSPVIFVTATTLALGKGQDIVGWTLIGIVTVALGCFILPMKRFGEFRIRNYLNACCVFGCLSGVGIAGMTMADYEALRRLRDLPGKPFGAIEAPLAYILFSGTQERSLCISVFKALSLFNGNGIVLRLCSCPHGDGPCNQCQFCCGVPATQYSPGGHTGHCLSQRASLSPEACRYRDRLRRACSCRNGVSMSQSRSTTS
jgi:hypothetical protein